MAIFFDAEVTPDDLKKWERKHGKIPANALVAMYSGWAAKLGTPAFTGKDAAGVFHFPGFSADAVDELHAYLAPVLLGAGPSAVGHLGIGTLADAVRLTTHDVRRLGQDVLLVARRTASDAAPGSPTTPTEES